VVLRAERIALDVWRVPGFVSRSALLSIVLGGSFAVGAAVAAGLWQVALGSTIVLPIAAVVTRSPFAGVLAWLLLVPYVIQGLTADTHPIVWALHRVGLPGLLILVFAYHALGIRRSPFRLRVYDLALVLFLILGAINIMLLAPTPLRGLVSFYDKLAVPIAFFWLVRAIGPRPADLNRLVFVGAWTVAVQATIGILSWVAPNVLPDQWLGRAGDRTVGTFGGPAIFTITLVLFALLAMYAAMSTDRPRWRLFFFGIVVAALLGVVLSLSRGSWLGAGIAMLGIAVLYRRQIGRFAVGAGVLALVLVLGPIGGLAPVAQERLETGDTVEGRIITNDAAVRMIGDQPLVGFGYGNFERFDERYKQRVGDIPLILGGSAHNTYLKLLVEFGIAATLLYLAPPILLLALSYRLWQRHRGSPLVDWRFISVLWLALLDQFVVNNFLEIIQSSFWATSLWWLTLGLIVIELERLRDPEAVPSPAATSANS